MEMKADSLKRTLLVSFRENIFRIVTRSEGVDKRANYIQQLFSH